MVTIDKDKLPACPSCQKVNSSRLDILYAQLQHLTDHKLPWYAWSDWVAKLQDVDMNPILADLLNEANSQPDISKLLYANHFLWACDDCISNGLATKADIEKQLFCDFPPYLAYVDKVVPCVCCQKDFVFRKEEQRFWYEDLGFWVQSIPKKCKKCSAEKKANNQLTKKIADHLKNLNKNSSNELLIISELYLEIGNKQKAKHYSTLADNLRKDLESLD